LGAFTYEIRLNYPLEAEEGGAVLLAAMIDTMQV
jgi:hypothetical protein